MPEAPQTKIRRPLSWAVTPASESNPHAQAVVLAGFRILLGLLWLYSVAWKRPPDFGKDAGNGLYKFTSYAVDNPVLPPFSWLVEHAILLGMPVFGWIVLIVETALAVMLLTGTYVRVAALLGIAESIAIGLSVAYAPGEWPWSYWLMIGAHGVLLFAASGLFLATDGVRAGTTPARLLGQVWGIVAILVGGISALRSLGDPLAATGPAIGSSDPSISFGPTTRSDPWSCSWPASCSWSG